MKSIIYLGLLSLLGLTSTTNKYVNKITDDEYSVAISAVADYVESNDLNVEVIQVDTDIEKYDKKYSPGELLVFDLSILNDESPVNKDVYALKKADGTWIVFEDYDMIEK